MKDEVTCLYCKYFPKSRTIHQNPTESYSKKLKKLKTSKKFEASLTKKCIANQKKINMDSPACHNMDPNEYFYCDKLNSRLHILNCVLRRRNENNFESYKKCFRCRQFDSVIKHLIEEYYISAKKVIPPKKLIRRRLKTKITRRQTSPKRNITRRKKNPSGKITRRK